MTETLQTGWDMLQAFGFVIVLIAVACTAIFWTLTGLVKGAVSAVKHRARGRHEPSAPEPGLAFRRCPGPDDRVFWARLIQAMHEDAELRASLADAIAVDESRRAEAAVAAEDFELAADADS